MKTINRFLGFLLATAIITFLLMVVGNAVRVGDAAQGCPDWPTCYGQWALPAAAHSVDGSLNGVFLQYSHRALAALATLMTVIAAGWAAFKARPQRRVVIPLALAASMMLVEAWIGGRFIAVSNGPWLSITHMALALISLGLVVSALIAEWWPGRAGEKTRWLTFQAPFARLSRLTLIVVLILLLSGTLVSALDAGKSCTGWPLCQGQLPQDGLGWLAFSHRLVVLAAAGLVTAQFARAWKGQRSQAVTLTAATGVFLLMLGQVFISAVKVSRGFPADLVALHAASSAGLWAVQVVVVMAAGLARRTPEAEGAENAEPLSLRSRAKDFLLLNKPIIVALLLVTTYAGMVVGGREIPGLSLTLWTLLGGALAAGGSSALNQYIDREIDKAMQRTARRPLPDGRLKPAEALAYGLGAVLASFFLLAGMVNLLTAVLSLVGAIYYVLIYSIWLKHVTVQNIVIGGGAGAIPPLVGWAAATGSLNVPSLFLFAIVFLWTPPHFWALALVRRSDYARGKVPMLPVVRGEVETRKQILIYTLELVALTLFMPVFSLSGTIYLVSAIVLGLWLLHTAWKVYKTGGNKIAYKMYRYSSMYLAFIMLALVIDVLI